MAAKEEHEESSGPHSRPDGSRRSRPSAARRQAPDLKNIVDLELLTTTEVSQKLKDGWTSILLVTGGTEERGPHDVLGGHTMMAHSHAVMIAKKLGKTLVAPVLPMAVECDRPESEP